MREHAEAGPRRCCRGMTAERRGTLATVVSLAEFLLLALALGPFGSGAGAQEGRTISRPDLRSRDLKEISAPDGAGVGTVGVDLGDGSLLVVKPRMGQIACLFPSSSLDAVERMEVLAQGDPAFGYPTMGVVVVRTLVFVATSFADLPGNEESAVQYPPVLIRRIHFAP